MITKINNEWIYWFSFFNIALTSGLSEWKPGSTNMLNVLVINFKPDWVAKDTALSRSKFV